jgi:hypothetical protein
VSDPVPEALEDGWSPATPPGDTVLRDYVDSAAHYFTSVGRAVGATVLDDDDIAIAHHGAPFPFANMGVARGPLDRDAWHGVLERTRAAFAGRGPWVIAAPFPTADLRDAGASLVGHPPFMTRAAGEADVPRPAGLEMVQVTTGAQLETFEATLIAAYPGGPGGSFLTPPILDVEGVTLWLAQLEGEPVGTALAHHAGRVNGVEIISCLPGARGRRIGEAVTWMPTLARPELPAALIASDLGRPVYERMGYVALLRFTLWLVPG